MGAHSYFSGQKETEIHNSLEFYFFVFFMFHLNCLNLNSSDLLKRCSVILDHSTTWHSCFQLHFEVMFKDNIFLSIVYTKSKICRKCT